MYDNIKAYLPNIPTDPTSTTEFYQYTASGNKFTLQSTLSDHKIYQYSSLQNSYSILTGAQESPTPSTPSGTIAFGTTVVLSSPGATAIYYTTDGSTPTTTTSATCFNQATTPVVINTPVTVKVLAVQAGYADSVITIISYTQATASTPTFSAPAGPVAPGSTIVLSAPGATAIYYTTNGSTPTTTTSSTCFNQATNPLVINAPVTVKVLAIQPGCIDSTIATITYSLLTKYTTPTFTPGESAVVSNTSITINSSGAEHIYYGSRLAD